MQIPSAIDVLFSVEKSLQQVVRPRLQGTTEQSCVASIDHLLRHVALRLEREGQLCLDDIAGMRSVLTEARAFCRRVGTADALACGVAVEKLLTRPARDPALYLTLEAVAAEASDYRRALQQLLDYLVAVRAELGSSAEYLALRAAIRRFFAAEIEREGALIDPAFDGKGPRR